MMSWGEGLVQGIWICVCFWYLRRAFRMGFSNSFMSTKRWEIAQGKRLPNLMPKPPKELEGEKYGHPQPPVDMLYRQLPTPPTGFGWEIEVVQDFVPGWVNIPGALSGKDRWTKNGGKQALRMQLRLVGFQPDGNFKVMGTVSKDLVWHTWPTQRTPADQFLSWSEYYEERRTAWNLVPLMQRTLIDDYLTWAKKQVIDHQVINYPAGEYKLKVV